MFQFLRRLPGLGAGEATGTREVAPLAEAVGLITSRPYFALNDDLVARLEAARANRRRDPLEERLDAFMLDPGSGPTTLLTREGRIAWTDDFGSFLPTAARAYAAINVGAKKTGVSELSALLPARPSYALDCGDCAGTGWNEFLQASGYREESLRLVCMACGGIGWRRDIVMVTPEESTWIAQRIASYATEAPEERRWLAPYVEEHRALPLSSGWVETEGIRTDGTLVQWSTEGEYSGTRPVDDPLVRHQLLGQATREHPSVVCLAPMRAAEDLACVPCGGTGRYEHLPVVLCICGGLGWVPRELGPLMAGTSTTQ